MALYTPLSTSRHEIRLLRILPAECPNKAEEIPSYIRCQLSVHQLEEDAPPVYAALSYVWGLPDPDANTTVVLNGHTVPAQPSLLRALQSFREQGDEGYIWADAICINQADLDEKKTQIGLMGDIYRLAERTVIWLGPSSDDSEVAMRALEELDPIDVEGSRLEERGHCWKAIRSLLQRSWWTRVWIVQEAFLSKNPIARCGGQEVPFKRFVQLKQLHDESYSTYQGKWRKYPLFQNIPFTHCLSNWTIAEKEIAQGGSSPFSWVTTTISELQCTEPRDMIYGVLGMCTAEDREAFVADYERPLRDLIIEVVLRSYKLSAFLFLNYVGPAENKDPQLQLPSWVPDLTRPNLAQTLTHYQANMTPTDPAWEVLLQRSKIPPEEHGLVSNSSRENECYLLYGCLCDIVTYADPMPSVPVYKGYDETEVQRGRDQRGQLAIDAFKKWEPLATAAPPREVHNDPYAEVPGGRKEAFWRTVSCDRNAVAHTGRGNNLPPDFGERYEALMGRRPPPGSDEVLQEPFRNDWVREYGVSAVARCIDRSFILTRRGRMGLAVRGVMEGDIVFIARGGKSPYVVRKRKDWGYTFVGEAYVHGVMDGEGVTEAVRDNLFAVKIFLR